MIAQTWRCQLLMALMVMLELLVASAHGSVRRHNITADHSIYLPIVEKPFPALQLHGYVTENGAPVAGVPVDLLYSSTECNPLAYPSNVLHTAITDQNGLYNFTNIPSLPPGNLYEPCYRTVYYNTLSDPQRLAYWWNSEILAYTLGSTVNAGNFDIADVVRVRPANGAEFPQPIDAQKIRLHFKWTPRTAVLTDTYYLILYEPELQYSDYYSSGPLGYVGDHIKEFTLCFAACSPSQAALRLNGVYVWRVGILHRNTQGISGQGETLDRAFSLPIR
jgi:hypothetical protein